MAGPPNANYLTGRSCRSATAVAASSDHFSVFATGATLSVIQHSITVFEKVVYPIGPVVPVLTRTVAFSGSLSLKYLGYDRYTFTDPAWTADDGMPYISFYLVDVDRWNAASSADQQSIPVGDGYGPGGWASYLSGWIENVMDWHMPVPGSGDPGWPRDYDEHTEPEGTSVYDSAHLALDVITHLPSPLGQPWSFSTWATPWGVDLPIGRYGLVFAVEGWHNVTMVSGPVIGTFSATEHVSLDYINIFTPVDTDGFHGPPIDTCPTRP